MTARILPFPLVRRVGEIATTARQMLAMSDLEARQHLEIMTRRHAVNLHKKGVDPQLALAECSAFHAAVTVAIWRRVVLRDERA